MKGFYIEVTNNLLDPKHRKAMGTAVWEFMWCLDKITKVDDEGIGYILGGKPVNLKEIANEIGITEPKISKNLNKLKNKGYLMLTRTPYGLIIRLNKAKKRFAHKDGRFALKGNSNIRQYSDSIKDNTVGGNLKQQNRTLGDLKEGRVQAFYLGQRVVFSQGKLRVSIGPGRNDWNDFAGELSELTIKNKLKKYL